MEYLFPDVIFLQMSDIINVNNKFMYGVMENLLGDKIHKLYSLTGCRDRRMIFDYRIIYSEG